MRVGIVGSVEAYFATLRFCLGIANQLLYFCLKKNNYIDFVIIVIFALNKS